MKVHSLKRADIQHDTGARRWTAALFVLYLAALGWILLLKLGARFSYMNNRRVSLIPFREYLVYGARMDLSQLVLNVLVFVPLGIYAGLLFPRWHWAERLFFFFLVSFSIECLQYYWAIGAFDSTDIITNTLGGVLGALLFYVMMRVWGNRTALHKWVNIVATIGTVLLLLFLVLLKLDMLPVRYR